MSNFSFSHSVFKRLVLQTHRNQGLFGKGVKAPIATIVVFVANVDQDLAAQNMQPDLGPTLSALMKLCRQKQL